MNNDAESSYASRDCGCHLNGLPRRDFLRLGTLAATGFALSKLPAMAGPFTREDFDKLVPADKKLYTWWSYRAKDWEAADRGRRLDHIWTTSGLAPACKELRILKEARGWTQSSDHVPVMARFAL